MQINLMQKWCQISGAVKQVVILAFEIISQGAIALINEVSLPIIVFMLKRELHFVAFLYTYSSTIADY